MNIIDSGLRATRIRAGLSLATVAARTGYSVAYLRRIERIVDKRLAGRVVVLPPLTTAERICKALQSPAFPDGACAEVVFYQAISIVSQQRKEGTQKALAH